MAIIGGGPGGLYAAALLKRLDPTRDITVWERNAPDDTFGFGVVLSDETLGGIEHADPQVYEALQRDFIRWDDIDIVHRTIRHTSGGHGFAALGRKRLLEILHTRCRELGVDLRFHTEAPTPDLPQTHDLVIAADGIHSTTRETYADVFRPQVTTHRCRYIWLAADFAFDSFRFEIAETEHGVMQLHGYPYAPDASTVIIEMREEVWHAAGFDELDEAGVGRTLRQDLRGSTPRPPPEVQQLGVDDVPHGRQRPLVARQRRPARRRRPHRPLLHRLRHQARRRGRPGSGRLPGGAGLARRRP